MSVDSYIQVPPDGAGKKIRAIAETNLSGDIVYSKVVKVSGETVKISGETVIAKASGETVVVASGPFVIAKISGEVVRSSGEIYIAKVSGEIVQVSGQTVQAHVISGQLISKVSGEVVKTTEFGYEKAVVSGAVICNIVSGQVVLHTVAISDTTSGFYMRIRDACSGATGTIIAQPYAGSRPPPYPGTLIFDCVMYSGIVVDTSGATWIATVTYKKN
jgi:hypothetical protein